MVAKSLQKKHIHEYNRDKNITEIFAQVLEMQISQVSIHIECVSVSTQQTPLERAQQQQRKKHIENENQTFEEYRGTKKKKIQLSCNDGLVWKCK